MNKLIIIGASGHGKVIAEIASLCGYGDIVFLDDNRQLTSCGGYPVAGVCADYASLTGDFFVAIGNGAVRRRISEQLLAAGKTLAVLIHPQAAVSASAVIGGGSVVMAGAVINAEAQIGAGCIVNTCASVDHECVLGDYVHMAVGSHLCGAVTVGSRTLVGAGATVINNLHICRDCTVGAGAVVIRDITAAGTYVGVPAARL